MVRGFLRGAGSVQGSWLVSGAVTGACLIVAMAVSGGRSRAYTAYSLAVHKIEAIPAFARKYGLACSACHTAWPAGGLRSLQSRLRDLQWRGVGELLALSRLALSDWPFAAATTPRNTTCR